MNKKLIKRKKNRNGFRKLLVDMDSYHQSCLFLNTLVKFDLINEDAKSWMMSLFFYYTSVRKGWGRI